MDGPIFFFSFPLSCFFIIQERLNNLKGKVPYLLGLSNYLFFHKATSKVRIEK